MVQDSSQSFDEETKKYLELVGVDNIDKQFNAAVQAYDTQIRLQAQQMYVSTAVSNLASANQMAESSQQLGTGASQVQAANFQSAVASQYQALTQQVTQSREEIMEALTQSYEQVITNLLGEQDAQGNFENILNYQQNAQLALDSLLMSIAQELNMGSDIYEALEGETPENYGYEEYLLERGYLAYTETPGEYEVTDRAIAMFDKYLNEDLTSEEASERLNTLASNMARAEYGERWDNMTPDAQAKAMIPYKEWFYENQIGLRYTTFGMWSYDESGNIEIDTIWEAPNINDSELVTGFDYEFTGDYISVIDAQGDSSLSQYAEDAISGKITDNSLVLANGEYYVYYQGAFYKTIYNSENMPPVLSTDMFISFYDTLSDDLREKLKQITASLDDGMVMTIDDSKYVYYDGNFYTTKNYFYDDYKLYKTSSNLKEGSEWQKAGYIIGKFGKLMLTGLFTQDSDKWYNAANEFGNSALYYWRDIAKYNNELKKNATEVK